jgi:hypothetical protein
MVTSFVTLFIMLPILSVYDVLSSDLFGFSFIVALNESWQSANIWDLLQLSQGINISVKGRGEYIFL